MMHTTMVPMLPPVIFFFLMLRPPPRSTLFPYTTLFRSVSAAEVLSAEVFNSWRTLTGLEIEAGEGDRKSTRLNSSHRCISYAVFCLKKKNRRREAFA